MRFCSLIKVEKPVLTEFNFVHTTSISLVTLYLAVPDEGPPGPETLDY